MTEQTLDPTSFGPNSQSWLEKNFADQKTHLRCPCGAFFQAHSG